MFGDVFDSLRGFCSHDFVMYGFAIGNVNEVMKSFVCKSFCLCQKLSVHLNLLKKKILCG